VLGWHRLGSQNQPSPATELSSAGAAPQHGFTAARRTTGLAAIAVAPELIKAKTFTIDDEAVVLGPDGSSRFEEFSRQQAARTAILYAFDSLEHDDEDLRNLPFPDRKAALARLLRNTEAGILLNEHIVEDGLTVFAHACRFGAKGMPSKRIDSSCRSGPCRVRIKVHTPPSIAVQRERSEMLNRRRRASHLRPGAKTCSLGLRS
jgi:bifunctional non-homologous end joining protein LigD